MTVLNWSQRGGAGDSQTGPRLIPVLIRRLLCVFLSGILATVPQSAFTAEPNKPNQALEARIQAVIPDVERYISSGMKALDVPGLGIGIIANDKLVYGKGFGVRSKSGSATVDTQTVFQIGSATKGFLATTPAMMVDRASFKWDDRVVDLYPDFQLKDPWVTREFRVFDLIAQRSGLPPYANDMLGIFGIGESELIRSLRHVEPVSSFRSKFAYTNITHLLAGRMPHRSQGRGRRGLECIPSQGVA